MKPRFSVIVPIYNVEPFIEKCIDSLINQKYDNVEILLVNDGSPDNCLDICMKYAASDKRIKVINQPNGGVVSARQAGCRESRGEYILNVDGDDWVSPNYFEVLDTLASRYQPDCICFNYRHVIDGKIIDVPSMVPEGLYDKCKIEKEIFPILIENRSGRFFTPTVWSKAIRRELYFSCLMAVDAKIKFGEDCICTESMLFRANSLYVAKEYIYYYRMNPQSVTKGKRVFSWDTPELLGKALESQINMDVGDFQEQVYRNVVHSTFNVAISQFYKSSRYNQIRKEILKELQNPYYEKAIASCEYSCWKNRMAHWALKNKAVFLMYLYFIVRKSSIYKVIRFMK